MKKLVLFLSLVFLFTNCWSTTISVDGGRVDDGRVLRYLSIFSLIWNIWPGRIGETGKTRKKHRKKNSVKGNFLKFLCCIN